MTSQVQPTEPAARSRLTGQGIGAALLNALAVLQFAYTVSTEDRRAIVAGSLIGLGILGASSLVFARWWNMAITLGMGVVLVGAGSLVYLAPSVVGEIVVGGGSTPAPSSAPPSPQGPAPGPPTPATDLRITAPVGAIPLCNAFTGTGTIPAGKALVLFDQSVGPGEPYWLDGIADRAPTGWIVRDVEVVDGGPATKGDHTRLVIVLVDTTVAASLDAGSDGWNTTVLPGPPADSITVVSGADARHCP
jgi:hypothetical protein